MKTVWIASLSAAAGVLLTLGFIVLFAQWYGHRKFDPDEIKRDYTVDYSNKEQSTYGKSCLNLGADLRVVLEREMAPVIRAHKPGQNWDRNVASSTKRDLDDRREYLGMCRRLYAAGKNGQVNGLQSLAFIERIDRDFSTLVMQMKYGAPDVKCDASCVDSHFRELEERYNRVLAELKKESPSQ